MKTRQPARNRTPPAIPATSPSLALEMMNPIAETHVDQCLRCALFARPRIDSCVNER